MKIALIAAGVVAAAAVAVAAFALVGSGGGSSGTISVQAAVDEPPPPAPGALILSREAGIYGVGVAVAPRSVTATVLSPHGGGASGLRVSFVLSPGGRVRGTACGPGCYRARVTRRPQRVRVLVPGAPPLSFAVPGAAPPAGDLVTDSARAMSALRTLVFRERLASSPSNGIVTIWKLQAPNRLAYSISTGVSAVVVGGKRWDRSAPGQAWQESEQFPLHVMEPAWGTQVVDARVLGSGIYDGRKAWHVTFANPQIPAFFDTWIDRRTKRTLRLDMTAAAHFMHHDRFVFNRPLRISPPA